MQTEYLDRMIRAALTAGHILFRMQRSPLKAKDKDEKLGAHFSTAADDASQKFIISYLQDSFPDIPIIAEEQEISGVIPENCFVVDPLDGTTNYYNGSKEYGVIITQLTQAQTIRAVVYLPHRSILLSAVRGEGCYISNPLKSSQRKISLKSDRPLDKVMLGTDLGPWMMGNGVAEQVLLPLLNRFTMRSMMSAACGTADFLMGRTVAYFNLNIAKVWDLAAGALMVREAGGIAVAPDGSELKFDSLPCEAVFAVNQHVADIVLEHTKLWKRSVS